MTDALGPRPRFSGPFVDMFEALRMAPVFARGRRDDRAGHVRSLTVSSSMVVAQVRGPGEPVTHRARIAVRVFGAAAWSRVEDELASQARYAADLLAGRMPAGIEQVFAGAGLNLLPLSIDEVAMDCSCEQWPMPCAHVAATVYAVARSFDADPFGAFAWRGRPRDELLHRLHQLRGAAAIEAAAARTAAPPAPPADGAAPSAPSAPGGAPPASDAGLGEVAAFWGPPPPESMSSGLPAPAAVPPDALLDQLDLPPPLAEVLRPAYRALP
ncbi:MAG TPA: hypothetical protein VFR35_12205 [Actinoplanes sp.]|nr:hypothetical protein [Actinoplanes sp.]